MTPKTLDKYIAALKKKAAAGGWSDAMYQSELTTYESEMFSQYLDGKISPDEYQKAKKKILNAAKNPLLQGKNAPAQTAGNPGQIATDAAVDKLEKEIAKVYGQAKKEMQQALAKAKAEYANKYNQKLQQLQAGKITQDAFDAWATGQVAGRENWQQQIDQCAGVMYNANKKAVAMINGEALNVFAENANWQSYQLTQDAGINISFAVYDERTVEQLIKQRPELLPRKKVNGQKDQAWNRTKISQAVTQSILQGESITELASRIARETASQNGSAMARYARTAMTGAQNSGRMEGLHRAQAMGIKCKKVWIATLDGKTRDSHRGLDGQSVDVDKPFVSELGKIKFPGDPGADNQADVWNCRCTLGYEYLDYPADPTKNERRDNESGEVITDMDYQEWRTAKEKSALNDLNAAKIQLAEAQKAWVAAGADEGQVFHNIWKDPVTLADYPDKAGSIQAKRDYYESEIDKLKQAQANGESWATDAKIKEKEQQLALLNKYEKDGKLLQAKQQALQNVQGVYDRVGLQRTAQAPGVAGTAGENGGPVNPFGPQAYTQERKDKALWAQTPREADRELRDVSGDVWQKASDRERDGIYEYTQSYHKYNEPLRGYEYGTSRFLGVGKTDLNAGYANNGDRLNAATDIISRSTYDRDIWLQRGCKYQGMDKFFNIDMALLQNGTQAELEAALLGTTPTEYALMSCGSNKGSGLNVNQSGGILLNIYCPAGTQMMYVEPFSAYGGSGAKLKWDGKSKQTAFGQEVETLLQQGTQFRVTKIDKQGRSGKLYVDMEVINQDHQQRWKP